MSYSLQIIFAGTPKFAARHLDVLIHSNHQIVGVFTQPDRPAGRGHKITASAVKLLAQQYHIPVFQPSSLYQPEIQHIVKEMNADIMVVVAYGLIFPNELLEIPKFGCINVHASLLPRWRGAAPIQRAICAGDSKTGVTIMQMDAGLDTGGIIYNISCDILPKDNSTTLHNKLAQIGSHALLLTLSKIAAGDAITKPQNESIATYAKPLSKKEARLNWELPASQLDRYIRAFNPWPVSFFKIGNQYIKVWKAHVAIAEQQALIPGTVLAADKSGIHIATYNGVLTITLLQAAGKRIMTVKELLNAHYDWFKPGTIID